MRLLLSLLVSLLVAGCVTGGRETSRPPALESPEAPALVSEVQSRLNAKGYNAGPVDGAIGPRTRDAIRRFEAANNLPVDGVIDSALLAALRKDGGRVPALSPAANTSPARSSSEPRMEDATSAGVTVTGADEAVGTRMADEHCTKFDKAAQLASHEGNRRRYNCVSF